MLPFAVKATTAESPHIRFVFDPLILGAAVAAALILTIPTVVTMPISSTCALSAATLW